MIFLLSESAFIEFLELTEYLDLILKISLILGMLIQKFQYLAKA